MSQRHPAYVVADVKVGLWTRSYLGLFDGCSSQTDREVGLGLVAIRAITRPRARLVRMQQILLH